ncbi:hypothetical protein MPNT_210015 [Candidatus Methylacidithermus pantelleriae]|uniref:Uncharacterized protein n=1 Tax=Candidatus Methylacidithermus pantelleriae TaxID=2744239 RepID=A0A8J2FS91_9BACT|nr:hypothetical protein MPNT_210015 [Candidatus Methylacidithermus pantelleriae]
MTPLSSLTASATAMTGRMATKRFIRLDLLGDHRQATFGADRIYHRSASPSHRSGQHVGPILRTLDPLVGHWIDAIALGNYISTIQQIAHPIVRSAIAPAISIARFLLKVYELSGPQVVGGGIGSGIAGMRCLLQR